MRQGGAPAGLGHPAGADTNEDTFIIDQNLRNGKGITFSALGPRLFARGISVIPLNGKRPIPLGWNKRPPTEAEVDQWAVAHPDANVGLLCGFSDIVGLDLDIYDAEIAESVQRFFGYLYDCPVRIGQAPKRLLLARCPGLDHKLISAAYDHVAAPSAKGEKRNISRIEVLGPGQQFAVAGTHPDTGQPYMGLDYDHFSLDGLPVVTEGDIYDLLETFETKAEKAGWRRVADRPAASRRPGTSVQEVVTDDFAKARSERRGTSVVDDFDLRGAEDFRQAMLELGWTFSGTGSFQIDHEGVTHEVKTWHCKHPGTDKAVSAAVYVDPRNGFLYLKNFSASIDLDTEAPVRSSYALAVLMFEGDYRDGLIPWLKECGYHGSDIRSAEQDFINLSTRKQGPRRRGFAFRTVDEVLAQAGAVEWLIDGLLPEGGFTSVFGDPATGKSFLALDLALHIAAGREWCGKAVRQGAALYIAGEGHAGMGQRIQAWGIHHGVDVADLPLFVSNSGVLIDTTDGAKMLEEALDALPREHWPPRLVVIDTRSRCLDGDEASTQDMARFINNLDLTLPEMTTKLTVHHAGHANKDRSRGTSSWLAALDTEFRVEKRPDGQVVLSTTKMKDAEEPPPMAFRVQKVVIDEELNGSIVLLSTGEVVGKVLPRLSDSMSFALQILRKMTLGGRGVRRSDWCQECLDQEAYSSRKAFNNAIPKLRERKAIQEVDGLIYLGETERVDKVLPEPEGDHR